MSRLRTAIVDDEPLARLRLRRLLSAHPDIEIVGDYDGAAALFAAPIEGGLHLLLLDIQMPDEDGFALLQALPAPPPYTLFVTAYAGHAARAFALAQDVDYLLKPVSAETLSVALVRARQALARREHAAPAPYLQRLTLPLGRKMRPIEVRQIESVVADGNYVEIKVGERSFVLRRALAWFADRLDPALFARIHRSTIVRIDAVESLEALPSGRYRIVLKSGAQHCSGRSYREQVRTALAVALPPE